MSNQTNKAQQPAAHSPLPWSISDSKPPKIILKGRPGFIATLGYADEGDREANAKLIVRAVNNLPAMEKLLREYHEMMPTRESTALFAQWEANQ